eukprot:359172-Chlamydomonas_euryale.AAC.2
MGKNLSGIDRELEICLASLLHSTAAVLEAQQRTAWAEAGDRLPRIEFMSGGPLRLRCPLSYCVSFRGDAISPGLRLRLFLEPCDSSISAAARSVWQVNLHSGKSAHTRLQHAAHTRRCAELSEGDAHSWRRPLAI